MEMKERPKQIENRRLTNLHVRLVYVCSFPLENDDSQFNPPFHRSVKREKRPLR